MLISTVLRNARYVLPIALVQGTVYFALNHYPVFESQTLPLTPIDRAIPFWPWTLWPYLLMISAPVILPLLVRDQVVFRQALWAYLHAIALTLLCHLLYPTHIERPDPPVDGTFQIWAFRMLLELDSPHSCFPSGHIVGPVILCWAFWRDGWPGSGWLLAFLPLLSLSILTTKQHYFWDWLAGFVLAALAIAFSHWAVKRE